VKFAFIRSHREEFPVDVACQTLGVSRSGYYAWLRRAPSEGARRREELTERIRQVHRASREIYGAPRIHRELQAGGVPCAKNTVAKLMREAAIRSKTRRRFVVRTTDSRHGHPIAPNRLNRRFGQQRPNQVWAADITYIPTDEGWLYLAVVLDLYSRKVVGWATSDSLAADLCCRALWTAIRERSPGRGLLHHSDRGVQYACDEFQELLDRHGLTPSMSRTGNCYDNAVMESFFSVLKRELTHHHCYATREAARQSLFEYIEVFYNRRRRHSSLDYLSPADYEEREKSLKSQNGKSVARASRNVAPLPRQPWGRGLAGRCLIKSGRTKSQNRTFNYPY
jgi:transposase InsO family protein